MIRTIMIEKNINQLTILAKLIIKFQYVFGWFYINKNQKIIKFKSPIIIFQKIYFIINTKTIFLKIYWMMMFLKCYKGLIMSLFS